MSSRWKHVRRIHGKKSIKKINGKTKFLYRQNRYLSHYLKRMSCNSLIQPHFDFACCAWYLNLTMSLKNRLQTAQKVCTRFCLGMERGSHIGLNHFENINWLPVKNRVDQCIAVTVYNFKTNPSPVYVRYIYSKFLSGSKNKKICGKFCWANLYVVNI